MLLRKNMFLHQSDTSAPNGGVICTRNEMSLNSEALECIIRASIIKIRKLRDSRHSVSNQAGPECAGQSNNTPHNGLPRLNTSSSTKNGLLRHLMITKIARKARYVLMVNKQNEQQSYDQVAPVNNNPPTSLHLSYCPFGKRPYASQEDISLESQKKSKITTDFEHLRSSSIPMPLIRSVS